MAEVSVFSEVCEIGGLDVGEFERYANEDKHTGYDGTPKSKWPAMSISQTEGKILYALVRMLKPVMPLEVGVWNGCSTQHILAAVKANGIGKLTSIDIQNEVPVHILQELLTLWHFVLGDALTCELPQADFVFEDGAHTREFTGAMIARIVKLNPKVIVSHDCLYPEWGHRITDGWRDAGLEPHVVDTGRGMCFWFRGETR